MAMILRWPASPCRHVGRAPLRAVLKLERAYAGMAAAGRAARAALIGRPCSGGLVQAARRPVGCCMQDESLFGVIELALMFGIAMAFLLHQLRSVNRQISRDRAEKPKEPPAPPA
jgi:hypothetical protein